MSMSVVEASALVAGAVAVGVGDVSVPYLGVPLQVVACALAGALFGIAYGGVIASRARMFKLVAANTFISTILVTVLPLIPFLKFLHEIPQAPLGGFIAFFSRWIIPAIIEKIPEYINRKTGDSKNETDV